MRWCGSEAPGAAGGFAAAGESASSARVRVIPSHSESFRVAGESANPIRIRFSDPTRLRRLGIGGGPRPSSGEGRGPAGSSWPPGIRAGLDSDWRPARDFRPSLPIRSAGESSARVFGPSLQPSGLPFCTREAGPPGLARFRVGRLLPSLVADSVSFMRAKTARKGPKIQFCFRPRDCDPATRPTLPAGGRRRATARVARPAGPGPGRPSGRPGRG